MEEKFKEESQGFSNGLNSLWSKYQPYWPVFLLTTFAAVVLGWFYMKNQVPQFTATTTILIKDKERGSNDSKVVEDLNPLASNNNIENEIELLKSQIMMREVVKNLHLYAPMSEKRKFVDGSAYTISPVVVLAKNADEIVETNKIYFKYSKIYSRVTIQNMTYPLDYWVTTPYGTLKFLPNPSYKGGSTTKPLYFTLIHPDNLAAAMVSRLDIGFISKGSTVVYINITDEVPEKAKNIVNELVAVYNHSAIADQNKLAANTLSFIEDRLKYVMTDLDSIEQKVQQYKAGKDAIDINKQGQLYLSNVSDNDQKIAELNTQFGVLEQVERYVLSKDHEGAILPSSMGITNEAMAGMLGRLHDAELQYSSLKGTVGKNNPVLLNVVDQINSIKPALLDNIRNQKKNLEIKKDNITQTNGVYESMLQKIPQKERELIDISREQNIKNTIYTFLLQKREETGLSYASTVPEIKIVDRAISYYSNSNTSPKKVYILAVLMGLGVSVLLISLKEMFNQRVTYRHDIERFTNWPIIGEIPYEKLSKQAQFPNNNQNAIFQQFRKLRASLNFLGINSKRKKILVTSFIPGEGKSFVAANLAMSLALTGKKVVLLEFDLNNPALKEKFNISARKGIVNYLVNATDLSEIVVQIAEHENLYMVPSGPLMDNPSELIMHGKVQTLLGELNEMFDYIVIDSAPVGPTPDAYTLASLCDASLFVIRHNYTPKALVKKIDGENRINPIKNAAIIYNGVQPRGFARNTFNFGYGYNYKYGDRVKSIVVRKNT